MRFRDNKIVEYRGIDNNSFDAAEQMMGHPIALPDMPLCLRGRLADRGLAQRYRGPIKHARPRCE